MTNKKIVDFKKGLEKKQEASTLTTPDLYEMNKQIIEQTCAPMMESELISTINSTLPTFIVDNSVTMDEENNYFMLLCHEDRNYTIFNVRPYLDKQVPIKYTCEELYTCLVNRGAVYSFEMTEDNYAIEIWLKDNDTMRCYYFFPYNDGVIEI